MRHAASYLGGDKQNYDALNTTPAGAVEAVDGDLAAWQQLIDLGNAIEADGTVTDGEVAQIEALVDVDNLIDYMLVIYFVNNAIGSNYLMINYKPSVPSLLHILPPWPWYILWMEAIGVLTFLLLYSPFIVGSLSPRKVAN